MPGSLSLASFFVFEEQHIKIIRIFALAFGISCVISYTRFAALSYLPQSKIREA
jgi:hypothetical protein